MRNTKRLMVSVRLTYALKSYLHVKYSHLMGDPYIYPQKPDCAGSLGAGTGVSARCLCAIASRLTNVPGMLIIQTCIISQIPVHTATTIQTCIDAVN